MSDSAITEQDRTDGASTERRSVLRRPWLVATVVVLLALVAVGAVWKAVDYRDELDALRSAQADAERAEQVASDYAVRAAAIDYRNFDPWFASLKSGVDETLANQFATSEPALRDLLGQLQWVSSGNLVGSSIESHNDGTYVVQVFVDVSTSNVQSPDGVQTTALYPITVDKNADWQITDISGGVAPLPGK
jgi:Mce-associated membrane protein